MKLPFFTFKLPPVLAGFPHIITWLPFSNSSLHQPPKSSSSPFFLPKQNKTNQNKQTNGRKGKNGTVNGQKEKETVIFSYLIWGGIHPPRGLKPYFQRAKFAKILHEISILMWNPFLSHRSIWAAAGNRHSSSQSTIRHRYDVNQTPRKNPDC